MGWKEYMYAILFHIGGYWCFPSNLKHIMFHLNIFPIIILAWPTNTSEFSWFSPCFANTAHVDIPYRKKMQNKKIHAGNLRYMWPICIRESKNSFNKAAFDGFIGACRYRY